MKNKFFNSTKKLLESSYNNKALFERRRSSFVAPLLIFILTICMMVLPQYIYSNNQSSKDVLKSFPEINAPLSALLTKGLDCSVKNNKLYCAEDAEQINIVVGENIKYTVIANVSSISANIDVEYNAPKDTDNFVLLLNNFIKMRYVERDHVNQKIITYEILGDYSEFEGLNFKEISQKIANDPSIVNTEVEQFVFKTYKSTLDTKLIVNLSSSLLSFVILVLTVSLIFKFPTLFKRKKGFKFSECLKLSLTSSLTALIAGVLLFFVANIEFSFTFGMIFVIRALYLYFKYILSSKNNIFKELYIETKEERFNI